MKPYVMIVDDNVMDQRLIKAYCERIDLIPIVVSNGFDAIDSAKKFAYSLFIVDLKMPGMDGFDFVGILRQQKISDAPVIVMSGINLRKEHILSSVQVGANQFVTKPVDFTILQSKIASLLEKKKTMFSVDISSLGATGLAKFEFDWQIKSISEMGLLIATDTAIASDKTIHFNWSLPDGSTFSSLLIVNHCEKQEDGFLCQASFVGLTDYELKRVRILMRELYIKGRARRGEQVFKKGAS